MLDGLKHLCDDLHVVLFLKWYTRMKRISVNQDIQEFSRGVSMAGILLLTVLSLFWAVRALAFTVTGVEGSLPTESFPLRVYHLGISGTLLTAVGVIAKKRYPIVKRGFDFLGALLGILFFLPLLIVIGIMIKIDSPGPVFLKQKRLGWAGNEFTILKFRTMYKDAERFTGPVWALVHDPRVTKVGSFLRKTSLDQLPQLFNVLKGEMSLVGPSPERAVFVSQITREIPRYKQRLKVKPGITGLSQIRYGYTASIKEAGKKLKYDLLYIEKMCATLDVKILYWSVMNMLKGLNASERNNAYGM